jgi:hypothetical protein
MAEAAQLCAGDPRAERAARQLKALAQSEQSVLAMQALLLEMARIEAQRQIQSEDFPEKAPPNNRLPALGRAHAAVTRMLHQNIEAENRIDDARLERLEGVVRDVKAQREAREQQAAVRKRCVEAHAGDARDVLEGMIEAEAGEDLGRADTLLKGLYSSLDEISAEDGFTEAPIGQIAMRVCKRLGFTPDWKAWSRKDWARKERYVEGSPYGPTPRIVRDGDGRYRFSAMKAAVRETGPP